MPKIGTPALYKVGSIDGAPSTCTDLGPPLRMMPAGLRASISSMGMAWGTISEYTCASRTRRAISWAYWAPKSTTRINAVPAVGRFRIPTRSEGGGPEGWPVWEGARWGRGPAGRVPCRTGPVGSVGCLSRPHADVLVALQLLALGLQRGGHHDLSLLELLHRFVSAGGHRRPQRAEQVEAAVVLVRRPD